ncbi:MAG: hypothetical protein NZ602_12295 [Thermoguttaceae bacterium]|nr:hypothetical protein [Thermoguttaceae bacterium]
MLELFLRYYPFFVWEEQDAVAFSADGKTDLAAFGYIDQPDAGAEPCPGSLPLAPIRTLLPKSQEDSSCCL